MKSIAKTETMIQSSAADAYSLLSNMERFGEWFPAVISITSLNDLPHGETGKKYLETVSIPLRGTRKVEITVKESVVNQRFVTEGRLPPLLPRMEISISEISESEISVRWEMFSRSNSKLVHAMLLPLARKTMQKRADIGAARLKALLENSDQSRKQ